MPDQSDTTSELSQPTGAGEEPPPLHRLFVGSVPRTAVEANLREYFEQCGVVRDLAILRDRSSGRSRGCAFVSYLELEEAEAAIQKFDRQLILPGSQTPLEVRFAKNHSYVQAGNGPSGNRQLFFSRVPLTLKEADVLALFEPFGEVESINIFKCRRSGRSKGCGFVQMHSREAAIATMESLDEVHVFDATGTAISVRWADPELQQRKKKAMDDANADNRTLFFAKVLRSTTEDDVRHLFSRFGKVHDVNLFRAFQDAPTTKGCGLVTMSQHSEAVASIAALDGKHVWEGMDCPMVVKWMDTALQRRRREQHLASVKQPQLPSASIGGLLSGQQKPIQTPYQPAQMAAIPNVLHLGGSGTVVDSSASGINLAATLATTTKAAAAATTPATLTAAAPPAPAPGPLGGSGGITVINNLASLAADSLESPLEMPPAGCCPDVIKLFVGNIPKSCTEEQLLPLFQSIGKVVELVILYDKVTHESKGSAFVWYAMREDAERAISQFNLRHVFPDVSRAQDRPLVVRRAKARSNRVAVPMAEMFGSPTHGQGAPAAFGTQYYQRLISLGRVGQHGDDRGGGNGLSVTSLPAGMDGLQLVDGSAISMATMGVDMGIGMNMGVGRATAAAAAVPQQVGLLPGGHVMVGGSGSANGGNLGGSVGSGRDVPRMITLATDGRQPAGLYDAYATGDTFLADYGSATVVPVPSNTASANAGGGYTMVISADSLDTSAAQWDTAAAVAAAAAAAARLTGTAANPDTAASGGCAPVAQSITLTPAQLQVVNQHLYRVQAVSGATLQLSATAAGVLQLLLSGTRGQVDMARHLVATVIGGVV